MNNKKHNLNLIEELVSTQYGDYGGYIQIDGHFGTDIFTLCADNGIDVNSYFVIGLSFGEHTTDGIGLEDFLSCSAILLEKERYGDNFDDISIKIQKEGGIVKAIRKKFNVPYAKLHKYVKRYDCTILTRLSQHISELEIVE